MDCLISLCEEIESQGGAGRENKKGRKLVAKLKARPRTVADLGVGESGRIGRIEANGPTRQRLLDMGITQGTKVSIQRLAPLGDPIEISLKGYSLAIRKSEARFIQLEP
jgi:ferrous iron transport protein A